MPTERTRDSASPRRLRKFCGQFQDEPESPSVRKKRPARIDWNGAWKSPTNEVMRFCKGWVQARIRGSVSNRGWNRRVALASALLAGASAVLGCSLTVNA